MYKGQKVYVVYDDSRRENCYEEIKSIGPQYIKIGPLKEHVFDAKTLRQVQSGNAKLWESKEAYEAYVESVHLRSELYREMERYIQNLPDDPVKLRKLVNSYRKRNGRKAL